MAPIAMVRLSTARRVETLMTGEVYQSSSTTRAGSLCWAGGDRGPDALDAGESAQREPGRKGADERRRPIEPDQAGTDGLGQPHVTHPDPRQGLEISADHDVDLKTGVLEAEVDFLPLE